MPQLPPSVLRVKLSQVLLAVRDKLLTDGVFADRSQAKISLRMNPPVMALQADQYAIVLPLSQFIVTGWTAGGGRFTSAMRGRLNVYPRNRNALDIAYEAESWLTDPQLGILDVVHAILDSLHTQFVVDPEGNSLLAEPMRCVYFGEPKQRYESPEWGDVVVEFETMYILNLTTTNPDGTVI